MGRQFIAKSLTCEMVDRAFVLVRTGAKGLSLDQWRSYAAKLIGGGPAGSGILTIENVAGTVLGLCAYRVDPDLAGGEVYSVEFLVALDLIDSQAVASALLEALEAQARRQGAVALRLDLPHGTKATERLLDRLQHRGHRLDRVRLKKDLCAAG